MSTEENKALIRYYFAEVMNRRNAAAVDELYATDFVAYPIYGPSKRSDLAAFKASVATTHAAIPDIDVIIDDQVAEGDKVATRWHASGTHQGIFAGVPASGKYVTASAMAIHRIVDGKIVELWEQFDLFGLFMQVGFPRMS